MSQDNIQINLTYDQLELLVTSVEAKIHQQIQYIEYGIGPELSGEFREQTIYRAKRELRELRDLYQSVVGRYLDADDIRHHVIATKIAMSEQTLAKL